MQFLKSLLRWLKNPFRKQVPLAPSAEERYHCVRIFRKEGDEIVLLLTDKELENGIRRAIEHIGVVPYTE